ncbi:hypothetical protein ACIBJF_16550 [Streptomyces sp. NPDC050743]|uniref:hypothetical protein n=1 Tax=Streptomyces sp. NPDC050743 TaxID=3365634 RepID=UPI0037AF5ABA
MVIDKDVSFDWSCSDVGAATGAIRGALFECSGMGRSRTYASVGLHWVTGRER